MMFQDRRHVRRFFFAWRIRASGWALAILLAQPMTGQAREWEPAADLVSAGAAASIVEAQVCGGVDAATRARAVAASQLSQWAQSTWAPESPAVLRYLEQATNQKIRALWQAQSGRDCSMLDNLRALAKGVGFQATR